MKFVKVISINDGGHGKKELYNGNYFCAFSCNRIEAFLNSCLNHGYEIVQVMSSYSPALQEEGNYTFYTTGYTIVLSKELSEKEDKESENKFIENEIQRVALMQ